MKLKPDFTGEVTSIPLSRSITSIWALPFGLLFQQQADTSSKAHVPISSTSPLFSRREISRLRRENENSPQHNFSLLSAFDNIVKGEASSASSHMILKDPLEEPQVFCLNSCFSLLISSLTLAPSCCLSCILSFFSLFINIKRFCLSEFSVDLY